jgi:hypothetical protein
MFGDTLKVHHGLFAAEPFRRERFEYALRRIAAGGGREVEPPGSATHPGYDLRVDGERWSLKTQANSTIRRDLIWISKWMELGKGVWGNRAKDLVALREAFLMHIKDYDRILVLRCLTPNSSERLEYELLEIPKQLLYEVTSGALEMKHDSTQNPKPGYCRVTAKPPLVCGRTSGERTLCYELYFDGGTERKLQVKNLRKDLCMVHATWAFEISLLDQLPPEAS